MLINYMRNMLINKSFIIARKSSPKLNLLLISVKVSLEEIKDDLRFILNHF